MNSISQSVPKRDHGEKVSGRAVYTADYPNTDLLTARVLRSTKPHAVIRDVAVPELPEGYFYVDNRDIPARNQVQMGLGDTPVFAVEEVRYIGDPIGLIVGPDPETVDRLLSEVIVKYEELPFINDPHKSDMNFFEYDYGKGDPDQKFQEADLIYEETFHTAGSSGFTRRHGIAYKKHVHSKRESKNPERSFAKNSAPAMGEVCRL